MTTPAGPASSAAADADPDEVPAFVCLAIHKPRGYVSEKLTSNRVGDEDDDEGTTNREVRHLMDAMGRPTVYNLIPAWATSTFSSSSSSSHRGAKGVSAIGRLDLETSGLMLFTSDGAMHAAVRGGGVEKVYVATVSGAGLTRERLAAAVQSIETPLQLQLSGAGGGGDGGGEGGGGGGGGGGEGGGVELDDEDVSAEDGQPRDDDATFPSSSSSSPPPLRTTKPARARVLREWRLRPCRGDNGDNGDHNVEGDDDDGNDDDGNDDDDDDDREDDEDENVEGVVGKSNNVPIFREHPAAERHWRAHRRDALGIDEAREMRLDGGDGRVVDVEIRLKDGKFHQVRRLVKRAGLRMRHLRRVALGPLVTLAGIEQPGACRALTPEEVRSLLHTTTTTSIM